MESYPTVNITFIDTYPLDEFVLVSYPTFLAFGIPIFDSNTYQLIFPANSYLKLLPYNYDDWIKAFSRIMRHTINVDENFECTIFEGNNTILKCTSNNEKYIFKLDLQNESQFISISFNLNTFQVVELFKGMQMLYFQPFILPKLTLFLINHVVLQKPEEEIKNLTSNNVLTFVQECCQSVNLNNEKILFSISDHLLRYKKHLELNKMLMMLLPNI